MKKDLQGKITFTLKDLEVALVAIDLNQTDQFDGHNVRQIRVCFYSSHWKGLDYHITKAGSKHHLKDR